METKVCNTCHVEKEITSFYSRIDKRNGKPRIPALCRSCMRRKVTTWRREHPESTKASQRNATVKFGKKYYLNSVEARKKDWKKYAEQRKEWGRNQNRARHLLADKLIDTQKERCAICNGEFLERYDIDHSHETGLIRGLLCRKCNSGLHYFEDKEFIEKASAYLLSPPASIFPPTRY